MGGLSIEDLPGPACVLAAPEGRVAQHNAAFAVWVGRDSALGVPLGALFPGDEVIARLWEEAAAGAVVEHHVARRGALDATSFWSVRARRIEGGVLVTACDLSAFADAARAVGANQQGFVAIAVHELRAPLSAIKAWASALSTRRGGARGDEEPLRQDGLLAIARQVDGMNELLSDLLEAARHGPGALRAVRVATPASTLIERALVGSPAASRVAIEPLPDDRVRVDPRAIAAAVARLVDAAAKRTEGPIAISAVRAGAEVHLAVADAGPPFSPAVEAELFGRASRSGRRLGLGLHAVRLFAAASGGRAWHEPGPETPRFVLALPADDAPPSRRARGPLRVLVALPTDAELAARAASVLRLEGHDVAATPSAHAREPDLVLADAASLDGALAALRGRPGLEPPVILAVAPVGPRPPALAGAERAGALAVLPTPLDWAEIVALAQITATARGAS